MMSRTALVARNEDGFTVAELLVTMMISLLVLFGALQSLDVFASNAAQQTRQTDANDQVRAKMDRTVDDLRGASVILRAAATDLVYSVPETTSTTRVERVCVDSNVLYGSSTVLATPALPAGACSTGSRLATLRSTSATTFTYDGATSSATPALVTNVGLALSLDSSGGGKTGSSTLKASAARRSAGTLPITDADLKAECPPTGTPGPLLSLSALLPNITPLTVTYSSTGGASFGPITVNYAAAGGATLGTPAGVTVQIPAGTTSVLATVTNAVGVTNTIRKDVTCTS